MGGASRHSDGSEKGVVACRLPLRNGRRCGNRRIYQEYWQLPRQRSCAACGSQYVETHYPQRIKERSGLPTCSLHVFARPVLTRLLHCAAFRLSDYPLDVSGRHVPSSTHDLLNSSSPALRTATTFACSIIADFVDSLAQEPSKKAQHYEILQAKLNFAFRRA